MNILFVSYGGGHAGSLLPVFKKAKELGYKVNYLALTTAQKYLWKQSIPFLGFKNLPGSNDPKAQSYGHILTQNFSDKLVSREESVAYMGLSYLELVNEHGEKKAAELYKLHGRQAFLPVKTLRRAIEWLEADLVITTNSPRAERAAILAAGELDLPSICLVDLFALQERKWIGQPKYASRVCVLNESVRQMFLKYGREVDEIVVTGNPAFDRLKSNEVKLAGLKMRETRGWNDGTTTLLWASQVESAKHPFNQKVGDPSLTTKIENVLRGFVQNNPEFRLVIRYHPSENVQFIKQSRVSLSPREENLHELLYAIDGVVTMTSTVGLEASQIGKTVISVDCSIFTPDCPYSAMGISQGVSSPEALPSMILELYKQGKFSKSSNNHLTDTPPNFDSYVDTSTGKVIAIIHSLAPQV